MSSKSRSKKQASREQDAPQQEEELLKHPVMMYPPITPVMVMAQQVPFYAEPDETSQVVGGARMKEVVPVLQSQGPWLMTVANFEAAWFQADWVSQVEQDSPDQYFKDQQVVADAFEERQDQTEEGEPVKTETRPYLEMADGYGMAVMPETTEELFVQAYAELVYAFEPNAELLGTYRHLMQVFSPDSLVELEDYITLPAEVNAGEKTGEGPMLPEERERAERSAETDTTAAQRSEQASAPGAAGGDEQQGARSVGILADVSPAVLMLVARSWGVDLSDVELVEDPALVAQGRKGAVRDGKTVRLAPGATNDVELLLEELCHIVQHRNAARGGADERAPRDEGALEAEADRAVLAARQGERLEVVGVASRELHDDGQAEEVDSETAGDSGFQTDASGTELQRAEDDYERAVVERRRVLEANLRSAQTVLDLRLEEGVRQAGDDRAAQEQVVVAIKVRRRQVEDGYEHAVESLAVVLDEHVRQLEAAAAEGLQDAALAELRRAQQQELDACTVPDFADAPSTLIDDTELPSLDPAANEQDAQSNVQLTVADFDARLAGQRLTPERWLELEFSSQTQAEQQQAGGQMVLDVDLSSDYIERHADNPHETIHFSLQVEFKYTGHDGAVLSAVAELAAAQHGVSLWDAVLEHGPLVSEGTGHVLDARHVSAVISVMPRGQVPQQAVDRTAVLLGQVVITNLAYDELAERARDERNPTYNPALAVLDAEVGERQPPGDTFDELLASPAESQAMANHAVSEMADDSALLPVRASWVPNRVNPRAVPLKLVYAWRTDEGGEATFTMQDLSGIVESPSYRAAWVHRRADATVTEWAQEATEYYPNGVLYFQVQAPELPDDAPAGLRNQVGMSATLTCHGDRAAENRRLANMSAIEVVREEVDSGIGTVPVLGTVWDVINAVSGEVSGRRLLGNQYGNLDRVALAASVIPFVGVGALKTGARRLADAAASRDEVADALLESLHMAGHTALKSRAQVRAWAEEVANLAAETRLEERILELEQAIDSSADLGRVRQIVRGMADEINALEGMVNDALRKAARQGADDAAEFAPVGYPAARPGHRYIFDSDKGWKHVREPGSDATDNFELVRDAQGLPTGEFVKRQPTAGRGESASTAKSEGASAPGADMARTTPVESVDRPAVASYSDDLSRQRKEQLDKLEQEFERPDGNHDVEGGLAGAVLEEARTGEPTKGRFHEQKARDAARALKRYIKQVEGSYSMPEPERSELVARATTMRERYLDALEEAQQIRRMRRLASSSDDSVR